MLISLSFPPRPLLKPSFSLQKPLFFSSIFTSNPRKGMAFHSLLLYLMFKVFYFMDLLVLLRYWNIVDEHGFLMKLIYGFFWEWWYNACFSCFYFMLMHYTMFCIVVCIPFCWQNVYLDVFVCIFGLRQVQNLGIIMFSCLEQPMVMCFTLYPLHDFMPRICTLFHMMHTHTIFDMLCD